MNYYDHLVMRARSYWGNDQGSESQLDYKTLCPAFEGIAPELLAVIADDVLGSLAAVLHGLAEELANIL